jgi:hypothetical protein
MPIGWSATPDLKMTATGVAASNCQRRHWDSSCLVLIRYLIPQSWPMRSLPTLAVALTDDDARLGAGADGYSFIATDLHRPLLAGLPAHTRLKVHIAGSAAIARRPRPARAANGPGSHTSGHDVEPPLGG